jgi:hypothetical protein
MSSLEQQAFPMLTNLKPSGTISPDTMAILARWFTKTAVAINVSQPFRLLVDATTRHSLSVSVPDNVIVSLFRVTDYIDVFDWIQNVIMGWLVPHHLSPPRVVSLQERSYQCQIRVAGLVGQVVVLPSPLKPRHIKTDALTIWPTPTPSPTWEEVPVFEHYTGGRVTADLTSVWVV